MPTPCALTLRTLAVALGIGLTVSPTLVQAQEAPSRSSLGIRGVGAVGLHAGYARVERGADAAEGSLTLDLGHFASRRVRLTTEASFLRTAPYSEYIDADDTTYRDVFYDLAGHVNLGLMLRDPSRRVVPYVSFGVGVHVLTSSFGSIPIDLRYNTNAFGLRAGGGLRLRTGRSGRHALVLEGAASLASEVSRGSVRLGTEWLFGDLARR